MSVTMESRVEILGRLDEALEQAKGDPLAEIHGIEIRNAIRLMFSLDRWPPDMSRPDLRHNFKAAWGELGLTADQTAWDDFPQFQPLPGNDYPNVVHFIKKRCGLGLPGYPDQGLTWDPDSVEWLEYA